MNDVALFTDALRAAVPARPTRELTATLVPRLSATARSAAIEAETRASRRTQGLRSGRPRSRRALVVRVALAVAVIPLALAGLAFAGVTVPTPARDAFDSVGITLPNQPSGESNRGAGAPGPHRSTQGGASEGTRATNGKGSSTAAHEHARAQHEKARGKALGHERGRAIGLNGSTPPGQAKTPPGQSKAPPGRSDSAPGQSRTPPGQSKSPPGQSETPPPGQSQAPPGHSK
jgi:hypothetical protein